MEYIDELELKDKSINGFFNHITNFNDDVRNELLNKSQYIFLSIIPVFLVLKLIQFTEKEILNSLSSLLEKGSIKLSNTRGFYLPENNN